MTIHLDLASPPKKATKEPKHERQHPTSKKHPSEGFGIAPKKGKAALGWTGEILIEFGHFGTTKWCSIARKG